MKTTFSCILLVCALFLSNSAFALTSYSFGFKAVTPCNNDDNCELGESALSLDVMDAPMTSAFTIAMAVVPGDAGAIKKIVFSGIDAFFMGVQDTSSMGTVNYRQTFNGNPAPVPIAGDLVYDTQRRPTVNGVNEGESFTVRLIKKAMTSSQEIHDAIVNRDLIVGLHVISIEAVDGYDSSERFTTVPVPGAALLFGTALLGMVGLTRRQQLVKK